MLKAATGPPSLLGWENLKIGVTNLYIWLDVLVAQGHIPWGVKIHNGIVKWVRFFAEH